MFLFLIGNNIFPNKNTEWEDEKSPCHQGALKNASQLAKVNQGL